jgi:hypothetical protein
VYNEELKRYMQYMQQQGVRRLVQSGVAAVAATVSAAVAHNCPEPV